MDQIIKLILTCISMIMLIACGAAQTESKQPEATLTTIQQEAETVSDKTTADYDKITSDTEKSTIIAADNTESGNKALVIYFSRTGNTEKIAEYLIELTGADSYVIKAAEPYTDEDIEYNNSSCRANREQNDSTVRPGIADPIESIDDYDTIFLGYPIWWRQEPRIIDTFLESYDFSDKTVIPFCTSGSSGIAKSEKNIAELVPIGNQLEGRRFPAGASKANALAEKEGFAKYVSIQGHYNLIFREEEREMAMLCAEDNIAMTPYSALASGRLARLPGETSKRAEEDKYAKFKYDATKEQDEVIIRRVAELAEKHGVSMTEISLAWLLTKVTSPIVGATKLHHIEGAVKAVDIEITADETAYLEESYVPHALAGVMAQNKPANKDEKHVWGTGSQKI